MPNAVGRPPKGPLLVNVAGMDAALEKVADMPVERVTLDDYLESRVHKLDAIFANERPKIEARDQLLMLFPEEGELITAMVDAAYKGFAARRARECEASNARAPDTPHPSSLGRPRSEDRSGQPVPPEQASNISTGVAPMHPRPTQGTSTQPGSASPSSGAAAAAGRPEAYRLPGDDQPPRTASHRPPLSGQTGNDAGSAIRTDSAMHERPMLGPTRPPILPSQTSRATATEDRPDRIQGPDRGPPPAPASHRPPTSGATGGGGDDGTSTDRP